ncbi:MAG: TraR/DksA C4-type zinc finger protein [Armatimonadota bacterium]|nr:TraR/DksA C4-type zinc finger protein [Armatimonadota bacterium]MDR7402616.1 TraR/DksA C4-type zinc finger protein [Armatimonadota bacterium]MDR7404537.1 TraR/DksA C4-type zinc finger protein [Armatimonadota bacterium]MDR7436782.1 TraR/DksA C4-type zinc finger protein [Armatimonadota bacterium]MDR7472729.1 TraR/DksA C4-type zinc finger protein [Armatimonadota bacterium]
MGARTAKSKSRKARPQAERAGARSRKPVGAARAEPARRPARPPARPLTRAQIAELRELLEQERDRLLEELEAMEEHTPEVEEQVGMDVGGGYDEDLADVASNTFEREKTIALESSVQATLAQVEEALRRMEAGTYGICERCGNPIDFARLQVLPYATLCINCKELEEKASR